MGGVNNQVRRARVGVYDCYRGVFLNRGVFLKAPPDFFAAYPSAFERPPDGWEKLKVTVREITHWDAKSGLLEPPTPKMEAPPPAPTVVPQPEAVVAAASEPVAAQETTTDAEPEVTLTAEKPVMPENTVETEGDTRPRKTKKKTRGRNLTIR